MLAGLATWVIVGHSERRARLRRDRRAHRQEAGPRASTPACARSCAWASSSPSARPGARPQVVDAQLRGALAGPGRRRAGLAAGLVDRLRARLGDRHRQERPRRGRRRDGRRDPREPGRGLGWGDGADAIPVLYGGSVTSANIGEFLAEPRVDGALIGGASLKPDEMAGIVARAGITARGARPRLVTEGVPAAPHRPRRPRRVRDRPATRRRTRSRPHRCRAGGQLLAPLAARASCARPRMPSACPPGQMGNSEVGHLNLGAGRPVLQDLPRIDAAIADGSFVDRPALVAACERAKATRPPPRRRA